jgi:hypothetical protein
MAHYTNQRNRKPLITFNADDVWAAACAAQRINGAYIKFADPTTKLELNREIVDRLLGNPTELIQEEDRAMGQKVRQYYQAFTFKILRGVKLSDFDNNAMLLANRETVGTNFELATIVCLPASYERSVKRDDVNSRINFATGPHIGAVGTKHVLNIEVLRSNFSQQYNVNFITGVTENDSVVFFAYKNPIEVGAKASIGGTIKALRDNQTQLNRVKVYSVSN